MTNKQLLANALVRLGLLKVRERARSENIPVPALEMPGTFTGRSSDSFVVSLQPIGEDFDKVIFVLADPCRLRACMAQELIANITISVQETFSNSSIELPFQATETVRALCFLHDKNADEWVATHKSDDLLLVPAQ